jgi:hypothetical protein
LHQGFGKNLAGFDLGSGPGGSENGYSAFLKIIYNTGRERVFGTNYDQVNAMFTDSFGQRIKVGGLDIQVDSDPANTGIPRCGIDLVDFIALGYLPDQCVFPGSTSYY